MQTSYKIRAQALLLHDAPPLGKFPESGSESETWENFDVHSVPGYIASAMPLIYANLERLEDLDEPYLPSQGSELMFMVEAVVQARSLLE